MRWVDKLVVVSIALWFTIFAALASASIPVMVGRDIREWREASLRARAARAEARVLPIIRTASVRKNQKSKSKRKVINRHAIGNGRG